MTTAEKTMALLCCDFGDGSKPLSHAEFKELSELVRQSPQPVDPGSEMTAEDLSGIGYNDPARILKLLSRPLIAKLGVAEAHILTRLNPDYPQKLLTALGTDAPVVFYYNGDTALLNGKHISLVGKRDCSDAGIEFAVRVGEYAAKNGYILVSGGARGADSAAEAAALIRGGRVISFLTSSISTRLGQDGALDFVQQGRLLLVCSQYPYLSFTAATALARNKYIHAISERVYVSDCGLFSGGTWSGTIENLNHNWSDICVFNNGVKGNNELIKRGCKAVSLDDINSLI